MKKGKYALIFLMCMIMGIGVIKFSPLSFMLSEIRGIHSNGLDFFIGNKNYSVNLQERKNVDDCKLQFDFQHPEEVIGKVIYEKDGARITVTEVTKPWEFEALLYFEVTGYYDFLAGKGDYISPIRMGTLSTYAGELAIEPSEEYICHYASQIYVTEKLKNEFSVRVWKNDLDSEGGMVTLQFCDLQEITWERVARVS